MANQEILTEANVQLAIQTAINDAYQAADAYFKTKMNGIDRIPCGFAWIYTQAHGNSKIVQLLKKHGFYRQHNGGYALWNPSGYPVQNVDCLYAGAWTAADTLSRLLGIKFYADSMLD